MAQADFLIIGGGIVGCTIGYGLARRGARVLVLDGSPGDFRASKANFGIVWVQGKGRGLPAYQAWTRESSDAWPGFAHSLQELTGIDLAYERTGGLTFCLGPHELSDRAAEIESLRLEARTEDYDTRVLDRQEVEDLLGRVQLGSRVSGASFCWRDAHVNPLRLLRALQAAIARLGGQVLPGETVRSAARDTSGVSVVTDLQRHSASKAVIASGVSSPEVARMFGFDVPVRPQRGQILVTERLAPILKMPTVPIRQTAEGTLLIGSTQEEVGRNTAITAQAATRMAARAVEILPALQGVTVVRQWAGLRIMSPDVAPIYAEAPEFPGVYVVTCHSGVTLAAAHATRLADAIADGNLDQRFGDFNLNRFNVSKAA